MAPDLHVPWEHAILDTKARKPFTGPEGLKLIVLAADFDYLMVLIVALGDSKECLSLPILFFDIFSSLYNEICPKLTRRWLWLLDLQNVWCLCDGIEAEALLQNVVVVLEPLHWVWLLPRSQASLRSDHGRCSIRKHDVILVCLVPSLQCLHDLVWLVDKLRRADKGVQVLKYILDLTGWCLFDKVLYRFDLVVLHSFYPRRYYLCKNSRENFNKYPLLQTE